MKDIPTTTGLHDAYVTDLAEKLCAAWLSTQMSITLPHAYKAYVKDTNEPIGEYWLSLAEHVRSTVTP